MLKMVLPGASQPTVVTDRMAHGTAIPARAEN
jgi:hypothetical protein